MHRRGAVAEAASRYAEVLRADPVNADASYYLAMIACQQGRFAEGAELADKALASDPRHASAHVLLGRALTALRRHEEALASFERAIAIKPDLAQAHGHRGGVLSELGRDAEAVDSYDRALALTPGSVEDWFDRGVALIAVSRPDDAVASFDRAIAGKPDFVEAHVRRAKLLSDLGRNDEALDGVDSVLAIEPNLAEAWLGRGNVLTDLGRYDEAIAAFDRALALQPGIAAAWFGRGNVLAKLGRRDDAFAAYDKAAALQPDLNYAAGARLFSKLHMCDWTNLDAETTQLLTMTRQGRLASVPFILLALPSTPADQLQCAERFAREPPAFPAIWRGDIYSHDRVRVAYLSADFHDHATANLTAGLFERHDKSRFDITGISFGPDDRSDVRHRLKNAFERFEDVQDKSSRHIADLIRRLEIDIAVDLKGFTGDNRYTVLARRPAPIQVNYLGYPGTMSACCIDYILADSTTIPEEHCGFYAEQVIWLPDSYQVNDNKRRISEQTPTRRECGLPEQAFVFCCFNNSYKITPEVFEIWARLLKSAENTVLWLLEANAVASDNLRREIEKRGVSSQRLIFAPRKNAADHLARQRLADMFLDTLPCNAHTTASDALWAGVPVLTCLGPTFAGRVAASLLRAAGLGELVTRSLGDYEALALKLAQDPSYLASIKDRLMRNRDTCALFNTERTTRQIESAYTAMWERYRSGGQRQAGSAAMPIRIAQD